MRTDSRKNFYNMDSILSINIFSVLDKYNISVNKYNFCKLRKERTGSCKIFKDTNSFYDYGEHIGGNVINLVEFLDSCDAYCAIDKLAFLFNIQAIDKNKPSKVSLSDNQYISIGIYGDKATKNMDFNFDKYSYESNFNLSNKYMMSMNELKEKHLYMYEVILKKISLPFVEGLSQQLLEDIKVDYVKNILFAYLQDKTIIPSALFADLSNYFAKRHDNLHTSELILNMASMGCKTFLFPQKNISLDTFIKAAVSCINFDSITSIIDDNKYWLSSFENSSNISIHEFCSNIYNLHEVLSYEMLII